ncbi:nucleotide sugar dehydrogenase [Halobacterium bonnevillei]|uniref:UDP-N-acetyl-D-mannosamine dehydrogenase n=1 Tax=Halobacterium bonnevillei TaxID=2692200 RepID=A0A6B0SL11_9EURY|nr:nucleotide sugar dehydrogenase [Halobacterium bonnevillei]MXR19592.1 nucleotide sugar dehydrogenase [Halobacterium bonnevillei]
MTETSEDVVCVVGLGYVGLPLALAFDESGLDVVGYDVDEAKTAALTDGTDPTGEVGDSRITASNASFTHDPAAIGRADYVIVTVPTPVDDMQNPNLEYVEASGRTIGEYITPGTTVVLESTVYPGATRKVLVPAIEATSGYAVDQEFAIGYSPERVSPGVDGRGVEDVSKIVGAGRETVREDLVSLYGRIVDAEIHPAPDIETAEAAKAIENVQRDINLALINELAMACDHMDLDTHDVLEAAGTKWNFDDTYSPGLVGGHCIPIDPLYLVYRSESDGFSPKLILQAREINEHVPTHAARLALRALNDTGRVLAESSLLLLGLAYKPNVADVENSAVGGVVSTLQSYDVTVGGYDPHADDASIRRTFDVDVHDSADFRGYDGVVLTTAHDEFRDPDLAAMAADLDDDPVFVDVPGIVDQHRAEANGFVYDKL